MDIYLIYKIECKINGKQYIGYTKQSIKRRFRDHIKTSKTKNYKLSNAIKKYGEENFIISEITRTNNKETALELEKHYIKELNTLGEGYNMTEGGDGGATTTGRRRPESEKDRISKTLSGKPKSDEHKLNMSKKHADVSGENNPFYGKTHSEETKNKIANREYHKGELHHNYGKKLSTSFKSGKDHPNSFNLIIDGIEYGSLREASRITGINLYQIRKIYNEQNK
jgi:group I intron endonuclease